jgi:hypothetical protein
LKECFPVAELVWLGSSTIRRKRVPGDELIFSDLTTTKILRNRADDLGRALAKNRDHLLSVGGTYFNLNRGIQIGDVVDEFGHVSDQRLSIWVSDLVSLMTERYLQWAFDD